MARQPPAVVVSLRRRSHAQGAGLEPPSFLPLQPAFPLAPRHLRPTGPSAPIISSPSSIPIHLLRCTTITPAAATTNLLLFSNFSFDLLSSSATLRRPFGCHCLHPLTSCCSKLSVLQRPSGGGWGKVKNSLPIKKEGKLEVLISHSILAQSPQGKRERRRGRTPGCILSPPHLAVL